MTTRAIPARFDRTSQENPEASLIAAAGTLTGTAEYSRANGDGTVCEIAKTDGGYAATATKVAGNDATDGSVSAAGLSSDTAGVRSGTTASSAMHGHATGFEINRGATTATIPSPTTDTVAGQAGFDGATIARFANVTIAEAAQTGAATGRTLSLDGSSYTATTRVASSIGAAGASTTTSSGLMFSPAADQVVAGQSVTSIFGVLHADTASATTAGGTTPALEPAAEPRLTALVNFTGPTPGNGVYDSAGLIADPAGDLFGTTAGGGQFGAFPGDGTVYEIPYTDGSYASTPTELVNFNITDGEDPQDSLIINTAGDLLGTTQMGGANGDGTVFEIPYTDGSYASTPTTLVTFNNTNGEAPDAGLYADAAGDLFGTTTSGGANGDGTVFEVPYIDGGYATTPTTLITFDNTNGATPDSILLSDPAGDLFGTTIYGGANGDGTVFEIAKAGSGYATTPTTLVTFNGTNGELPAASLIADAAGNLFGTAYGGGPGGDGTVFEVSYTDGSYATTPTTLASFDGTDGANPHASLIIDAVGDLFGTTSGVGIGLAGTVFEVAKTDDGYASTPTTLANVSYPVGNLIANAAGELFSTTAVGGANGDGMVFELSGTGFQVVPCYLRGTRIAMRVGELAVEDLRVGDVVRTLLGAGKAPVIWVGHREVDCAHHPKPRMVWPVRVAAGAFGPGRPHTDLFLSPDHAVYVNEVLISIRHLINGSSIEQMPVDHVSYYHIELVRHDVVLAQGLPAESFLDMKDGTNYADRPGPVRLYPDFTARMWEAFGCARLIVMGPELAAARALVARFTRVQAAA